MKKIFFFFLFCPALCFSQKQETKFQKYKSFLKRDTSGCALINFQWHFQYGIPNKISNVPFGGDLGMGINFARFFTKKLNVSLFGTFQERGLPGLLFQSSFNSNLGSALHNNANLTSLSHNDSVSTAYFISQSRDSKSLGGCGRYLYGLSFYVPIRFSPMIRIYRGLENVLVNNSGLPDSSPFSTEYEDWMNLDYDFSGISITFFYNPEKDEITRNNFALSFFFEKQDFGDASINGVPFKSFLNPAFFPTYNSITQFGIKLGWEFF